MACFYTVLLARAPLLSLDILESSLQALQAVLKCLGAVPRFPLQWSLYMEGTACGFFCISVFCTMMTWESRRSCTWL